ncbi:hypothetical protein BSL78_17234 [Apostichopus japonicus]|uniref:AB hydrolase-1 domain-containing protein n=1 Tax=Stichopus japonicus TaxID=307972 RepID=A0A2G8KD52_STIJA|nr:hypothetical protein BSL78_17234 [Apostichopus japonicus]
MYLAARRGYAFECGRLYCTYTYIRKNQLIKCPTNTSCQTKRRFHRVGSECLRQRTPIKLENRADSFFTLKEIPINALGENFNVIYAQAGPKDGDVVLMVHGSPASHKGFQNMAEPLVANGYQVILPNFPGMGWTPLPSSGCYNFSLPHKAQVLQGLVEALKFEKVLMLCGHSMGCQAILHISLLPDFMSKCQSICFVSSIGMRPHKLASPYFIKKWIFTGFYHLCQLPVLGPFLRDLSDPLFQKLGLKGRTKEAQVNSSQEAAYFDWKGAETAVDIFRQRELPMLLFQGDRDKIVQLDIALELLSGLGIKEENIAWYKRKTGKDRDDFSDNVLQRGVVVEGGDHSIFSNSVDIITPEQLSFLKAVKQQQPDSQDRVNTEEK